MKAALLYITATNVLQARHIGRALVEERLVACVNILDGVNSLYWWDGAVQDETEAVLLAKTKESLVPDVIARVKELHSYDCPCVVSLPILDGNPDFLAWIDKETRSER